MNVQEYQNWIVYFGYNAKAGLIIGSNLHQRYSKVRVNMNLQFPRRKETNSF